VAAVQNYPELSFHVLSYLLTANGFEDGTGTPNMPSQETTYAVTDETEFPLCMKISRDSKKLALTHSLEGVFIANFNNTTGTVTPLTTITNPAPAVTYGIEFSPNSALLYYTAIASPQRSIHQIDMQTLNEVGTITSSTDIYLAIQLGLDDRMYVGSNQNFLHEITNPDVIANPLILSTLPLSATCNNGLPQWVWRQGPGGCFYILNQTLDVVALESDYKERIEWINATNVVNTNGEAIYHAGDFVELNTDFTAEYGSVFSAYIEGCTGDFSGRSANGTIHAVSKNKPDMRLSPAEIKIYPNPSSTSITIQHEAQMKTIAVISMDGKTVMAHNLNTNIEEIDISQLKQGVYLIIVETQDSKTLRSKFIKN
jgi:hypothetical protein